MVEVGYREMLVNRKKLVMVHRGCKNYFFNLILESFSACDGISIDRINGMRRNMIKYFTFVSIIILINLLKVYRLE